MSFMTRRARSFILRSCARRKARFPPITCSFALSMGIGLGRIRAEARTGLYSLALTEPPVFRLPQRSAAGVSARSGDDPFRGRSRSARMRTPWSPAQKACFGLDW